MIYWRIFSVTFLCGMFYGLAVLAFAPWAQDVPILWQVGVGILFFKYWIPTALAVAIFFMAAVAIYRFLCGVKMFVGIHITEMFKM